ncbi:unnamed protein product [Taenia asiatica]|uniref:Uncharacterized protein n=1 Tax=Taenia asiatica TaxID=60517 RepID=A0A0R3WDY6_TAEAS|nr:unnamed protein product [Taenia asiatica]
MQTSSNNSTRVNPQRSNTERKKREDRSAYLHAA